MLHYAEMQKCSSSTSAAPSAGPEIEGTEQPCGRPPSLWMKLGSACVGRLHYPIIGQGRPPGAGFPDAAEVRMLLMLVRPWLSAVAGVGARPWTSRGGEEGDGMGAEPVDVGWPRARRRKEPSPLNTQHDKS